MTPTPGLTGRNTTHPPQDLVLESNTHRKETGSP